jgi:excisionase family DNA binding protein
LGAEEDPPLVRKVPKIPMLEEDNARHGFLEPEQYEAKEVARRLSRPLRSIHQMAKVGTIPSRRDGRRVMFRWADVQRAVEAFKSFSLTPNGVAYFVWIN